jgi:hypothetical protein
MKKYIKVILAVLSAFLILLLCACDLDEFSGNLQGGDLLDAGRISEIKEEVLATEESTTAETSYNSATEESDSDERTNDTENTENTEVQSDTNTSNGEVSDENIGDEVYWTESGGVWHLYRDCGHLKNSQNVLSGTVADAEEAGKDHVCSSCNKKAGKD